MTLKQRLAEPSDIYEGHSPQCHAVHPSDRQCNCHLAFGFATAEAMDEHDTVNAQRLNKHDENERGKGKAQRTQGACIGRLPASL